MTALIFQIKSIVQRTKHSNTTLEIDLESNDFMKKYKVLNQTQTYRKNSKNMAYAMVIVIFTAFAKKNTYKIQFEKRNKINKVVPLLSFYMKVI